MVEHGGENLSVRRKCELLDVNRSRLYYKKSPPNEKDAEIMNVMRELYEQHPFFGYRRIHALLLQNGYVINRKRITSNLPKEKANDKKQPAQNLSAPSSKQGYFLPECSMGSRYNLHQNKAWLCVSSLPY